MRSPTPPGSPHGSQYNANQAAAEQEQRPVIPYPTRELLRQDRENRDFVYNLGFAVSVLEDMLVKFETTTRARLAELNNKAARLERLLTYVEFFVSGGAPADAELPFPTPPASPVASVQQQLSATNSPRLGTPTAVASASKALAHAEAETPDILPPRDSSPRKTTSSPRHVRGDSSRDRSRTRSTQSPRTRLAQQSPPRDSRHRVHSSPSRSRRGDMEDDALHSKRGERSRSRGRREDSKDSQHREVDQKVARRASPAKIRDSFTVNSSFQDWRPPASASVTASTEVEQIALRSSRKDELVNMDSDEEDSISTQPVPVPPQVDDPDSPRAIQWSRTMDNALYESLAFPGRASTSSSVAWHAAPRPTLQAAAAQLAADRNGDNDGDEAESSYQRDHPEDHIPDVHTTNNGTSNREVEVPPPPTNTPGRSTPVHEAAPRLEAALRPDEEKEQDDDLEYGTHSLPAVSHGTTDNGMHPAVARAAAGKLGLAAAEKLDDAAAEKVEAQHDVDAVAHVAGAAAWKANLKQIEEQLSGLDLQTSSLGNRSSPPTSAMAQTATLATSQAVAHEASKPPIPRPAAYRASYNRALQVLQEDPEQEEAEAQQYNAVQSYHPPGPSSTYHASGPSHEYHAPGPSDAYHASDPSDTYHAASPSNAYHPTGPVDTHHTAGPSDAYYASDYASAPPGTYPTDTFPPGTYPADAYHAHHMTGEHCSTDQYGQEAQEYDASPLASQSSPIDPEAQSLPDTDVPSVCHTPASASYPHPRHASHRREEDTLYEHDFMLPLPYFLDASPAAGSHTHDVTPSHTNDVTPRSEYSHAEGDTPGSVFLRDQHAGWHAARTGESQKGGQVGGGAGSSAVVNPYADEHLQRFSEYVPALPRAEEYPWDTEASMSSPAPRVRAPLTASQGG